LIFKRFMKHFKPDFTNITDVLIDWHSLATLDSKHIQ